MKHLPTILIAVIMLAVLSVAALQMTAPTATNAADAATLARANQLYENGQYAAASALYEQLVAEGVNNSTVYYNLGNTQMQTGQYSAAVDSYIAAQALAPRDADIANNLTLARQQAGLVIPDDTVWTTVGLFSRDELAVGALLLWGMIAVVVLALRRRLAPGLVRSLLAVLVFSLIVTGALYLGQITAATRQSRLAEESTAGSALIEEPAAAADSSTP